MQSASSYTSCATRTRLQSRVSLVLILSLSTVVISLHADAPLPRTPTSTTATGNPLFPGWYADPEATVFDHQFWIYPTFSAPYDQQVYMDAFSSPDMVHWTKHPQIVDTTIIPWAKRAMWAPAISRKNGKYFFFFAANDIQHDGDPGGLGIAVADGPAGPFHDYLGHPLINRFYHGAQPIDPFVFTDEKDGQAYLIYGGWRHCVIGRLKDDYSGLIPFPDGELVHEITPEGYVEGSVMFIRNGKYYFMWSEGVWTTSNYNVAYAIGDSPLGPFKRLGTVFQPDPAIGTGAGHHSVVQLGSQDRWLIIYHRHPAGEKDGNGRVTCAEWMHFNADGTIQPVPVTNQGVGAVPAP